MRLFLVLFLLFSIQFGWSQTTVIVPEQFEILDGKDKYQINSLTVFLLQKKGVNANFAKDISSFNSCDVGYADVVKLKSFLATKLQLVIKDCEGTILYESPEGYSKFKDYRKAYQDALRKIFEPIEVGEITFELPSSNRSIISSKEIITAVETPSLAKDSTKGKVPQSKFTSFVKQEGNYVLKQKENGFLFYKENNETGNLESLGTIDMDTEAHFYFSTKEEKLLKGFFDASGSLHIMKDGVDHVYLLVTQ